MSAHSEAANGERVDELLAMDWRMLINGELVGAAGGRTFDVTSPISEQRIASVPDAEASQIEAAVAGAALAFPAWRATPPADRARLVTALADTVEAHARDLALLDSVDCGAPTAVMEGDVRAAADHCRYFAGLALEMQGNTVPASENVHFSVREPYGVVVRITPFNHPIMFAIKALAAPLVAGNCVVLKPAEVTPLSALHMARLIQGIFPPGVVQLVLGNGPTVPRTLVRHPLVHRIAFTGSEQTGRSILRDAADTGVKNVSLELGGKNALIAYPDADPDEVAAGAVQGMNFTWSGQSCGSTSRLVVHESIADAVVTGISKILEQRTIGSPLDPCSDQGPLVSRPHYERVLNHIATAIEDGATLVTGGQRPEYLQHGYYLAPTVFDRVDPNSALAQEEIFGPVLAVIRWSDDDPIAIANSVRYGLTASVYTNDVRRAHRVAKALQAGYVWINDSSRHFLGMPFGGFKASGLGREESLEELLSFTQLKSINIAL